MPDYLPGDEIWDLSLVDPDNRRPVDYELRRRLLDALRSGVPHPVKNAKLYAIQELLALRRRQPLAFSGTYTPLGANPATTCAFSRGDDVVVVVATRDEPADAIMPVGNWRNVLGGLEPLYGVTHAVYERGE